VDWQVTPGSSAFVLIDFPFNDCSRTRTSSRQDQRATAIGATGFDAEHLITADACRFRGRDGALV
jgi:hypothetical protein